MTFALIAVSILAAFLMLVLVVKYAEIEVSDEERATQVAYALHRLGDKEADYDAPLPSLLARLEEVAEEKEESAEGERTKVAELRTTRDRLLSELREVVRILNGALVEEQEEPRPWIARAAVDAACKAVRDLDRLRTTVDEAIDDRNGARGDFQLVAGLLGHDKVMSTPHEQLVDETLELANTMTASNAKLIGCLSRIAGQFGVTWEKTPEDAEGVTNYVIEHIKGEQQALDGLRDAREAHLMEVSEERSKTEILRETLRKIATLAARTGGV